MSRKNVRRRKAACVQKDDEFVPACDSVDDLETFNEEMALTTRAEQELELEELNAESELPLDELLRRYGMNQVEEFGEDRGVQVAEARYRLNDNTSDTRTCPEVTEMSTDAVTAAKRMAEEDKLILSHERLDCSAQVTKPLPRFPEPAPNKCHWQHVLEEMTWLSGDFSRERKWRGRSALKAATLLSTNFERRVQKISSTLVKETLISRKNAKLISSMVTLFWNKVGKVLALQSQAEDAHLRKLQLDAQLDELIKTTESYSSSLADRLRQKAATPAESGHSEDDLKVPLLKHALRDYQVEGVRWLMHCYTNSLNVLLADEMGLGKTIQTIALLSMLATEFGNWGPHLIVVPTSVMLNWEVEFKKWCPALKVFTYYGSVKERRLKRHGWSKPNSFHVCITSYRIATQDQVIFRRKNWEYLILDEAHMIKNWRSQRWQVLLNFSTRHRLLITGTPLQNDLMELWALMHFLMPDLFSSHAEFKNWFANPLSAMVDGTQVLNQKLVVRLHSILRPFIMRRLKSDVEKTLPDKHEHIVKCTLSRRQRRLYEEYISSSTTLKTLSSGNVMGVMNCLMQLRKVCNHPDLFAGRHICSSYDMKYVDGLTNFLLKTSLSFLPQRKQLDLGFLRPSVLPGVESYIRTNDLRVTKEPSKTSAERVMVSLSEVRWRSHVLLQRSRARYCTQLSTGKFFEVLSMEKISKRQSSRMDSSAKLNWMPTYHSLLPFTFLIPRVRSAAPVMSDCVSTGLHDFSENACQHLRLLAPMRPTIIRQSIFFPDKRLVQFDCGKLQVLATLLRRLKQNCHKVLIFTQMTKMLDVLEAFINLHGYTYCRLDGSTSTEHRQLLMQRFNNDTKIFLFILSTRSGGFGINLTGADTVIFYDSDWNPAMDQQAQDRCHRIGQTRDVHIYRLISEGTIEESILQKAFQKRELDSVAIQLGQFNSTSLVSSSMDMSAKTSSAVPSMRSNDAHSQDTSTYGEKPCENMEEYAAKTGSVSRKVCNTEVLLPIEEYALRFCNAKLR